CARHDYGSSDIHFDYW
nr:immunoglobulin heavy chain junction region [Macaca mulatta]MOW24846.1 immunoglobulin heavy chain junction region [Macaca mulatta]MOW25709.1 immunoglobulin heavy chain junction region [Macaca mulatta]